MNEEHLFEQIMSFEKKGMFMTSFLFRIWREVKPAGDTLSYHTDENAIKLAVNQIEVKYNLSMENLYKSTSNYDKTWESKLNALKIKIIREMIEAVFKFPAVNAVEIKSGVCIVAYNNWP